MNITLPFISTIVGQQKKSKVQTGVGLQQSVSASPTTSHLRRQKSPTPKRNKKAMGPINLITFKSYSTVGWVLE
jgi:hypothetical protein